MTINILYFVSGATSLAYEILWVRMLSLQFGVSTFGVVVTVSAFMIGLGTGSVFGTAVARRTSRPLLIYGVLEIAVGMFAALMPVVVQQLSTTISAFTSDAGVATWYALHGVADILLMTLPSCAMGAAFPLILHAAGSGRVGSLYGINALGSTIGALAPIALLPTLGWMATTQLFALVGIALGTTAIFLGRTTAPRVAADARAESPAITVLGLYAAIGAGALMLEIGWTRLYGMILLRTEYVLAVIVAVYLAGIGLGSVIAKRLTQAWWMHTLPVLAGAGALASLWLLPPVSRWAEATEFSSLTHAIAAQAAVLAALTLPATLAFGAWLPLLAARYVHGTHAAARLYGANSIGAAVGALVAGFVLIPGLGTTTTIAFAALLVVTSGLLLARTRPVPIAFALAAMLIAAAPVWQLPTVHALLPRTQADTRDVFVHEDAVTITHVVERADGERLLLDDLQRIDASSDPDDVALQHDQVRLPLLLYPNARSVLLLGLGTGISAAATRMAPALDVTAVELSQGAIAAAGNEFAAVNDDITRHIRIIHDDARRALAHGTVSYDVIVGDLFHPDLAGRSALLSVEQFERARNRLNEQGVFVQWLSLTQFDAATLDIVLRSFAQVFPQGALFIDPFSLALVGTRGAPVELREPVNAPHLAGEEGMATWLGRYLGRIALHVTPQGPVQSETAPRIEYLLPKARYRGELDVAVLLQGLLKRRPTWNVAVEELNVPAPERAAAEKAYAATDLALAGWVAGLNAKWEENTRLLQLAYQANPRDRWIGVGLVQPAWTHYEQLHQQGNPTHAGVDQDERSVLDALLRTRQDFVPALKAKMRLERDAGHTAAAEELRGRVHELSPLDVEGRAP